VSSNQKLECTPRAARRPGFRVERSWCCKCCQEIAQFRAIRHQGSLTQRDEKAVSLIYCAFASVLDGCYGGVSAENLFD
jgi:hypothetical protein